MRIVMTDWICEKCNDPIAPPAEGEEALCQLCQPIELENAILTRPGEDIIARVEEERDLDRFENDMKGRP